MKSRLDSFLGHAVQNPQAVTGGFTCTPNPKDPCEPPTSDANGNNGIGQEKRGLLDGPPPGLAAQPRQDFNDGAGNIHGV